MRRVTIDDLDPAVPGTDLDRRGLSGPLGTGDVAVNWYRIPPGEGFPSGLHTHADQEEIFVVLDGTATFETLAETPDSGADREDDRRDGEDDRRRDRDDSRRDGDADSRRGRAVTVEEGQAVRFAPGEYQSGRNDGDRDLVALAIGAPRDSGDVRVPVACPACDGPDLRLDTGGDGLSFVCPDCGAERAPAPCPDCGADAMHLTLGEDRSVVAACRDCGAESESPPFRD